MSRGLEADFLACFTKGHLAELVQRVREDKDLDFQIRENYINIYYKGHSLLKLTPNFKVESAFIKDVEVPSFLYKEKDSKRFVETIPMIKDEIRKWTVKTNKENLEGEYEQLIIRANNLEKKTASEYYIIDRQYQTTEKVGINRFDLTGFYWNNNSPSTNKNVPMSFIEVKFSLNNDIQELDEQLGRYYEHVKSNINELVKEHQEVFKQQLKLSLINQNTEKLAALSKITFSTDINEVHFVVVLVDYNPNSELLKRAKAKLKKLSFAKQIKFFYAGFAIWEQDAETLGN